MLWEGNDGLQRPQASFLWHQHDLLPMTPTLVSEVRFVNSQEEISLVRLGWCRVSGHRNISKSQYTENVNCCVCNTNYQSALDVHFTWMQEDDQNLKLNKKSHGL
jgi:hypothetical protein